MTKEAMIAIVAAAKSGDADALNTLFQVYYNDVYYFALKTVKDSDLACDVTQETFLEIFNTIGQLQEPAAFVSWMKRITYHQCTRYFKKKKDVLVDETEDGGSVFDTLEETNEEFIPAEALDKEDFRKTILSMIDELSEEQRAAVMMFYFDEMSVRQIAEIQGVSEGTVKSRLNYARKAIKASVEDYENKHGIKLHALPFFPFMGWLFKGEQALIALPQAAAQSITATLSSAATSAGVSAASITAQGASTAASAVSSAAQSIAGDVASVASSVTSAAPAATAVEVGVSAANVTAQGTSTAASAISAAAKSVAADAAGVAGNAAATTATTSTAATAATVAAKAAVPLAAKIAAVAATVAVAVTGTAGVVMLTNDSDQKNSADDSEDASVSDTVDDDTTADSNPTDSDPADLSSSQAGDTYNILKMCGDAKLETSENVTYHYENGVYTFSASEADDNTYFALIPDIDRIDLTKWDTLNIVLEADVPFHLTMSSATPSADVDTVPFLINFGTSCWDTMVPQGGVAVNPLLGGTGMLQAGNYDCAIDVPSAANELQFFYSVDLTSVPLGSFVFIFNQPGTFTLSELSLSCSGESSDSSSDYESYLPDGYESYFPDGYESYLPDGYESYLPDGYESYLPDYYDELYGDMI